LVEAAPVPQVRVIPVVGSLPGNFGAQFRTSLQLYNAKSVAVSGKLVFHPAGVPGSASDPSLAYSIAAGKTLGYADVLPAMGIASGIGSIDVVADATSAFPVVLARVYNDAGAAGTTGLAEEALAPAAALQEGGAPGVLLVPPDLQKFRLNIGIRTLDAPVAVNVTVRDRDGNVVATAQKSYDATFFAQTSAAAIVDGYAFKGGESLTFQLTAGRAFIYGSTTDNTTNDPSVQFARPVE
jgi:hypothetical protein